MEQTECMASGVPQLDLLLGGGIRHGSVVLVAGATGTGKTVLSAQIAWQAAARGERVVFITVYSEPHAKLLAHLHAFTFFDRDQLGGSIKLLSLQQQFSTNIQDADELVVREAREHNANLVVLDGLPGVTIAQGNVLAAHQFLFDLGAKLSLFNITTLVTHDRSVDRVDQPALMAVDIVINLAHELHGAALLRIVQVVKNRGMAPLLGQHSFTLGDGGIVCYPRQETVLPPAAQPVRTERLPWGVPRLDAMLGGGLYVGTATIVAGGAGVGKTLLCLHYVKAGIDRGECTLLLTFHETPQQLALYSQLIGLDMPAAIAAGTLTVIHCVPVELNVDQIALQLRQLIDTHAYQRLVIDGFNEIERVLQAQERTPDFVAALLAYVRHAGLTTCLTQTIDPLGWHSTPPASRDISTLADTVLLLQHNDSQEPSPYMLSIRKMRLSQHERQPQPYTIGEQGIEFQT